MLHNHSDSLVHLSFSLFYACFALGSYDVDNDNFEHTPTLTILQIDTPTHRPPNRLTFCSNQTNSTLYSNLPNLRSNTPTHSFLHAHLHRLTDHFARRSCTLSLLLLCFLLTIIFTKANTCSLDKKTVQILIHHHCRPPPPPPTGMVWTDRMEPRVGGPVRMEVLPLTIYSLERSNQSVQRGVQRGRPQHRTWTQILPILINSIRKVVIPSRRIHWQQPHPFPTIHFRPLQASRPKRLRNHLDSLLPHPLCSPTIRLVITLNDVSMFSMITNLTTRPKTTLTQVTFS